MVVRFQNRAAGADGASPSEVVSVRFLGGSGFRWSDVLQTIASPQCNSWCGTITT